MLTRPLLLLLTAIVASTVGPAATHAQVPSFTGVGDLVGGTTSSVALDVSGDGGVVVGESEGANGTEAFVFSQPGGITGLGFLSMSDPLSRANGVSADGSVIVGSSRDGSDVLRAYRYSGGGMTVLANQSCSSCDPLTEGFGVSANGLVVVGSSAGRSGASAPLRLDPVRWPAGGTSLSDLGNLSGGDEIGEAFGVSSTGGVIAGSHQTGNGKEAFYWDGGVHVLPSILAGSVLVSGALAVSDDGSTIVGYSNSATVSLPGGTEVASEPQAVRWTGAGFATLTQLGSFPGAVSTDSRAFAVSSDGAIVVGSALDADLSERAFLWDAGNGMRDLKTVLVDEYGLDLFGWVLTRATGISDVVSGDFSIVGAGINPQGEPEGWVAFLATPACSDGVDNDTDTNTDYPADPGCTSPVDWSEQDDCNDGIDNDGDADVDFPADLDCLSLADPSEGPDCSDGIDNDSDSFVDYPDDPGCAGPDSPVEDPACDDGVDNDADLATDYPADLECNSAADASETPDCSDGLDNDLDGDTDYPADAECTDALDASEGGECADEIDNDGDGRIDYPEQYPGCIDAADPSEAPQCDDGEDNDADGDTDYPADAECSSLADESESPVSLSEPGLFAVDRASRAVFRVDTLSGAQTLVSEQAFLQEPQGIAQRGAELVVADPAGLVAVAGSGAQRLASAALVGGESLQVVIDANLDALVLEADGVSKVIWNDVGLGSKSSFLSVPTPEGIPVIGLWHGDAAALEASGDLLVTGLSFFGDGVFRVDQNTQAASILATGFNDLKWLDLAVESNGTILAVGYKYDQATGVYRVDPTTGVATALNNTYGWQMPTGVAVAASGDIFVADSGVCADGLCAGGEIVRVDPSTGVATPLSTGGFIAGQLDLVFVPEPHGLLLLAPGLALLAVLTRRRARGRGPVNA